MPMRDRAIALIVAVLVSASMGADAARADNGTAMSRTQAELVNRANAPISNLFEVRLQGTYALAFD